eukprot:m.158287 g.158287  ORF g.158287 m.158287 type:complete len:242 (-) comp17016_c0_seq1:3392-4117(-)
MAPVVTAAVLLLLLLAAVCTASFDADRVRYIDHYQGKGAPGFLFRGNLPIDGNGTFVYSQLKAMFPALAAKANVTLSSDFFLTILSFLNLSEYKDEEVEIKFAKQNPDLAEYINWPIVGDLTHPDHYSEAERRQKAIDLDSWQIDKLPSKMSQVTQLLRSPHGDGTRSRVIYMHCEAGMDRTGEMSGSYYMYAQNSTFYDALAYDETVEPRNISIYSQNAFQWYCYNLFYTSQPWQRCRLE